MVDEFTVPVPYSIQFEFYLNLENNPKVLGGL